MRFLCLVGAPRFTLGILPTLHPPNFYNFAITGRSSNLFWATISALTGRNPAQRFRSPDGEQNRKIFLTFFNRTPPNFFSIKETKIFLFCPSSNEERRKRFLPQTGRAGKNSFPPDPLFFLPARIARFAGEPPIFMPAKLAHYQFQN